MKRFTFFAVLIIAVLVAGPVLADRIILAPTGNILGSGQVKAEAAISPSNDNAKVYWLGIGMQKVEVNITRFDIKASDGSGDGGDGGDGGASGYGLKSNKMAGALVGDVLAGGESLNLVNAAMSVLPETTLTPGIGIGVWDLADDSPSGRGYYLAISKGIPLTSSLPSPISDVKVHAGYGTHGMKGLFAGAEASLPMGFRLATEYFQKKLNFSASWGMIPTLNLKVIYMDSEPFYGIQFNSPF